MSEGFTPRRGPPSVDGVLDPAPRVPASIPDAAPTKTDIASRASRSSFGLMSKGPAIQAAVAALTLHYEHLDPLMGDIEVMGDKLYLTAAAFHKQMQAQIPLVARRWVKRIATPAEYDQMMMEPWRPNPRDDLRGFVGHGSRLWYVELWVRPWCYLAVSPGEASAIAVPVEDAEWYCAAASFGEANELNCDLTIAAGGAKLKGDPRVLDRMAIKRGEHEALREVVSFTLRGARNVNQVELLRQGVTLSLAGPDETSESGNVGGFEPADQGVPPDVGPLREYARGLGIPPRFIDDAIAVAVKTQDPRATLDEYREQLKPRETFPAVDVPGSSAASNEPAKPSAEPAVASAGGSAAGGPAKPRRPGKPKPEAKTEPAVDAAAGAPADEAAPADGGGDQTAETGLF